MITQTVIPVNQINEIYNEQKLQNELSLILIGDLKYPTELLIRSHHFNKKDNNCYLYNPEIGEYVDLIKKDNSEMVHIICQQELLSIIPLTIWKSFDLRRIKDLKKNQTLLINQIGTPFFFSGFYSSKFDIIYYKEYQTFLYTSLEIFKNHEEEYKWIDISNINFKEGR